MYEDYINPKKESSSMPTWGIATIATLATVAAIATLGAVFMLPSMTGVRASMAQFFKNTWRKVWPSKKV